jgi:hypothetical protein
MISASALNAGFIFTIITLLLTQLPSALLYSALAQIVLIFLYILFLILLFVMLTLIMLSSILTKPIPPRSKKIWLINFLWGGSICATGIIPILLFLLWNLILLVYAALISWIFFLILAIISEWKPFLRRST